MINIIKNQRGITLVTLVITIVLLIIITATIAINSHTSLELSNLTKLENDIQALDNRVAAYYVKNGELPVTDNIYTKAELQETITNLSPNDGETYYAIDLSKLDNLTLNYENNTYIINETSHNIYNLEGVEYKGEKYFTISTTNEAELVDYVAEYNASKITLTLNANGGIIPAGKDWTGSGNTATKLLIIGNAYGELPIPTRDEYTFLGWSESNVQEDKYILSTTTVVNESTHTLYAIWFDEKQILLYDLPSSRQTKIIYERDITNLYDLSEHGNNAALNNISLAYTGKAIQFNGTSSYAELNLQSTLNFPLTIEMDISTTVNSNSIIYIDGNSKIALGIYGSFFICVGGSLNYPMYDIPSDFFDGNVKHVVVIYESLSDYKVFVNGDACSKSSQSNYWSNSGTKFYLGRRSSGTYFNGFLYNFRVFNRIFEENEYTNTNNRNNLIVEYNIEDENSFDKVQITTEVMADLVNKNDSICYDVELNNGNNGIVFNGLSSYLELGLKTSLEIPLSIEMTISCPDTLSTCVIYADPISKTALGCHQGQFICITNSPTMANVFDIPTNFFDGSLKHIVIEYTDLFNTKIYVNGEKCNKSSNMDVWDWNDSSTNAYIGRRPTGTYFKGTLYNFSIYNSLLPEEIIKEKYAQIVNTDTSN